MSVVLFFTFLEIYISLERSLLLSHVLASTCTHMCTYNVTLPVAIGVVRLSLLFVNFEHIPHLVLVFLLLTLNMGWVELNCLKVADPLSGVRLLLTTKFLVLIWSASEGWKAESTLEHLVDLNPGPLEWGQQAFSLVVSRPLEFISNYARQKYPDKNQKEKTCS